MKTLSIAAGLILIAASVQAVEINVGDLLRAALRDVQAKQVDRSQSEQAPTVSGGDNAKGMAGPAAASGPLVGKTYKDALEMSRELHRGGLQDEQSFNLGAANANTWIASYVAGHGGRRILITKSLDGASQVLADIAVTGVPKGLQLMGSSELGPDDEGDGTSTTCTLGGKKAIAFGYMKRTGKVFSPARPDWAWTLGANGAVLPLGRGAKVACK